MTHYRFESDLVDHFCSSIPDGSPWPSGKVLREFDYRSGRTDVVITHGDIVVAIEAKLERWKTALHQAYRNTCFADQSFVLLPEKSAKKAQAYFPEFTRRGVGLLSLHPKGRFEVLIESEERPPVLPALRAAAVKRVNQEYVSQ